jgi:hypothetical protein
VDPVISDQKSRIPHRVLRARRRRLQGHPVLIVDNYYFAVDEFADEVWNNCTGRASVAQIASQMASPKNDGRDVDADLVRVLESFVEAGLVEWKSSVVSCNE